MSDFVHCNKCLIKHGASANIKFHLTECGHLFCHRCADRVRNERKCSMCNKATSLIQLGKDVDQHIMDFFTPLEQRLKKTMEIYEFQQQHRNSFFRAVYQKYQYSKNEYFKCQSALKKATYENKMLRSMLCSTGHHPPQFLTSTPKSQISVDRQSYLDGSIAPSIAPSIQHHTNRVMRPLDNTMSTSHHPGYAHRVSASASSYGPSPMQKVPLGAHGRLLQPSVHRNGPHGTMLSMDQLRHGLQPK